MTTAAQPSCCTHEERVRFADAALAEVERALVNIESADLDRTSLDYAARRIADMRRRIAGSAS